MIGDYMKDVVEINDIDIGRNGKFDEVMLPNKLL